MTNNFYGSIRWKINGGWGNILFDSKNSARKYLLNKRRGRTHNFELLEKGLDFYDSEKYINKANGKIYTIKTAYE